MTPSCECCKCECSTDRELFEKLHSRGREIRRLYEKVERITKDRDYYQSQFRVIEVWNERHQNKVDKNIDWDNVVCIVYCIGLVIAGGVIGHFL